MALFLNEMLPVPRSRGYPDHLGTFCLPVGEELENMDWLGADKIAVEWMKGLLILSVDRKRRE